MRLDPISLFLGLIQSMLGWAFAIFITQVLGFWLGLCLGSGELYSPCNALLSFPLCAVGWVLFPQFLIAVGVTALCWYLPIRFEGARLRLYAAAANLVVWAVVVTWITRISPFH